MSDWFLRKIMLKKVLVTPYNGIHTFIVTSFCKHNQEPFQFLLQMFDFAARQRVDWVSQGLEMWVANSPCPPHRRVKWGFLLILQFGSCQTVLAELGFQFLVKRQHIPPTQDSFRRVQHQPSPIYHRHW